MSDVVGSGHVNRDHGHGHNDDRNDDDDGEDNTPCYCRGTLILTPEGEAPVEVLKVGDRVMTLSGKARPIRWVGRRAYDGRFIIGRASILPIRVSADALSAGVPARDLWISPGHALYIDG
ncbi:MAG TPA: Hint domain-containing protein, partial [Xanthobacteraceae bacterium]|nr:Hint domain-containing protein [Xanthobacteraceae bacterium]